MLYDDFFGNFKNTKILLQLFNHAMEKRTLLDVVGHLALVDVVGHLALVDVVGEQSSDIIFDRCCGRTVK